MAVLLMNNDNKPVNLSVMWAAAGADCGADGCAVRDLWQHADAGRHTHGYSAEAIAPRDSVFIVAKP